MNRRIYVPTHDWKKEKRLRFVMVQHPACLDRHTCLPLLKEFVLRRYKPISLHFRKQVNSSTVFYCFYTPGFQHFAHALANETLTDYRNPQGWVPCSSSQSLIICRGCCAHRLLQPARRARTSERTRETTVVTHRSHKGSREIHPGNHGDVIVPRQRVCWSIVHRAALSPRLAVGGGDVVVLGARVLGPPKGALGVEKRITGYWTYVDLRGRFFGRVWACSAGAYTPSVLHRPCFT